MRRINPVVSQQAYDIVQKIPKMHKGEWVSGAIVEKHARDTGTDLQAQIDELRARVERLEKEGKG